MQHMQRKKKTKKQGLRTAMLFFVLVLMLILISLSYKLSTLVKGSSFDGENRFNVLFESLSNPKLYTIVSLDPKTRSASIVDMRGTVREKSIGYILGVPIDGRVTTKTISGKKDINYLFFQTLTHYREIKTSLTIIDIARLFVSAREVAKNSIVQKEIVIDSPFKVIDKEFTNLFTDQRLVEENISIEVVNATSVSGLGTRLARLISNIGGTVIAVSSSDQQVLESKILYKKKKNYTLFRLQKILGFPLEEIVKSEIADIIIVLGKDSAGVTIF